MKQIDVTPNYLIQVLRIDGMGVLDFKAISRK